MRQTAASESKPQGGDRLRLTSFGNYLRDARGRSDYKSQTALAGAISKSQSFVAQLEAGGVLYPEPELLRILAEKLNLEYPNLVQVYAQSRFSLSDEPASVEKAVGLEVRDVEALARWESSLAAGELWIVVRNFVDQDNPTIQAAVATFVSNGGSVTYFSDNRANFEGAKEGILARVSGSGAALSSTQERINFEYVPPQATRFMMAGAALYNPRNLRFPADDERSACEAFLIVNDGGHPDFGIRVASYQEKKRIYTSILAFLSEKQTSEGDQE
ncbi:MAG TPA: helix-turn-helix transcriptional regulator [Allosphingosinicella sp.]|nr:helix-turn-helix transcriptional regulator [Allosphingosinicella sp.]